MKLWSRCSIAALLISGLTVPGISAAADPQSSADGSRAESSDLQLQEVVVTAQRSRQNLQNVPISVSAIQAAEMQALQIVSTKDLDQLVPGLLMNRKSNAVQPFVRGIGVSSSAPGLEAPVAVYVDGVYIPTAGGATFDLPDVERVEVLKGPQGTLFGRNATSGALNIVTRQPSSTPGLEAEVGYASYSTVQVKAYGSAPLGETLKAGLSFYFNDQNDGWGEILAPGKSGDSRKGRVIGARGKLVWDPSELATVELAAFYTETEGDITGFAAAPGVLHRVPSGPAAGMTFTNPGLYDSTRTTPYQGFKFKHYGQSLGVTGHFGEVEVVNTLALQKFEATTYTPIFGGTPFPSDPVITAGFTDETFSNELRAQYSSAAGHRLMAGVYYLSEKLRFGQFNFNTTFPPFTGGAITDVKTTSKAVFVDGTFAVGGGFSVTGGLRYTDDGRDLTKILTYSAATGLYTSFPRRELDTSKTTYRIVGQWQASDDIMAYVSRSSGYKAGFFNLGTAAPTAPPLQPELLTAHEIGLKSELLDRRVRLNVAAFRNGYSNIVVQQTRTIGGLTSTFQTNAARARTEGIEADIYARVTSDLTISGGVAYMPTAKYTNYVGAQISTKNPATGLITSVVGDATGNRLIQAPKLEAQLQVLYSTGTSYGRVDLASNLAYRSKVHFIADNRLSQDPVTLINASAKLTLPGDRYSVAVWVRNLADEGYISDAVNSGGVDIVTPGSPRTVGVTLRGVF